MHVSKYDHTLVYLGDLPVALRLVQRVSKANPVCTRGLADTQVHHGWHGDDELVLGVASVDEGLLGVLGKRLPSRKRLLCRNVRADDVDVQILSDGLGGDGQDRGWVRRRSKGRSIVDDDAGGRAKLGFDGGEDISDGGGRREVGFDGEVAIVGLAVGALAGREGDVVTAVLERLGDRSRG
jgi:hypothetical protein